MERPHSNDDDKTFSLVIKKHRKKRTLDDAAVESILKKQRVNDSRKPSEHHQQLVSLSQEDLPSEELVVCRHDFKGDAFGLLNKFKGDQRVNSFHMPKKPSITQ